MSGHGPYLIVANPTSGCGRGRRIAESLAAGLRSNGQTVELLFTAGAGDAERRVREALGAGTAIPRTVVACGGDGTIQQVARAVAEANRAGSDCGVLLALAPAGRCNDFSRALGLRRSPEAMLNILLRGRAEPMDLGMVNGRSFCTVATLGLDAEVTDFVDRMRMPLRGTPAYLYGAARVLLRYRPHVVRITGDFPTIEGPMFLASTANTALYGGAIPIVPHADPRDGRLDLCVIHAMSLPRALPFIPRIFFGRHVQRREVQFVSASEFRIESPEPLELWADGERIGRTPVDIRVAPGVVTVLRAPE